MIRINLPRDDHHALVLTVNYIGMEFGGVEKELYRAVTERLMHRLHKANYALESCQKRLDTEINKNKEQI